MQKNKDHNRFFSIASSVFMVLALLLSSCTTKRGIKTVLNIPINVSKTYDSGKHFNTQHETEFACIDYGFSLTDKQDLDKDLDSPGILSHFTYELPQTYNFLKAYIFSYISPKFITEVPRYLLFKKLIIHQF